MILVLLLFLALRVYLGRKEAEPPKWMEAPDSHPKFSFRLGFLLLGVFPTDIITLVGTKVAREGDPWLYAVLFILMTLFLLALPSCCSVSAPGRRLPAKGAGLDEHELVDRERDRDRAVHWDNHQQHRR